MWIVWREYGECKAGTREEVEWSDGWNRRTQIKTINSWWREGEEERMSESEGLVGIL